MYTLIIILEKDIGGKNLVIECLCIEQKIFFEKIWFISKKEEQNLIANIDNYTNIKNNSKYYSPNFDFLNLNIQKLIKDIIVDFNFKKELNFINELEFLMIYYEHIQYVEWLSNNLNFTFNTYDSLLEEDPHIQT